MPAPPGSFLSHPEVPWEVWFTKGEPGLGGCGAEDRLSRGWLVPGSPEQGCSFCKAVGTCSLFGMGDGGDLGFLLGMQSP